MSYFDDNEDRIIYGRSRHLSDDPEEPEPRDTSCRHCGKNGLNWEHDGDGWVLMEGRYRVHKCSPAVLHAKAANDFDDLDGSK